MQISAALVKELRERTGAGMMECKNALVECDGDITAAIEHLRKTGLAKAEKKAGRIAAEGVIVLRKTDDEKTAVLVEINCETDFVTKEDEFLAFADRIAALVLAHRPAGLDALLALAYDDRGESVDERSKQLVAKIGEKISLRRFTIVDSSGGGLGAYLHGKKIGVLVDLANGDADLAKDIAMHVAASRPVCISENEIPPELLEKEKEILTAQAQQSGKPAAIIEKMVQGRLKKYVADVTLLGQPFVKDPDVSVGSLVKDAGAAVKRFERFEVGEGLEKRVENFAEEVMAQAKGA